MSKQRFYVVTTMTRTVHIAYGLNAHDALRRWAIDTGLTGYLPRWSTPSGEAQVFGLQSGEIMEQAAVMPAEAEVLSEVMADA